MQYLGTEVSQLGGLFEMEVTHGRGALDYAGIVVVEAVDVGPYLYLFCLDGGSDDAGGVVGPAALQVVDFFPGVEADKALGQIEVGVGGFVEELPE